MKIYIVQCIVELMLVLCMTILDVFKLSKIFSTPFSDMKVFSTKNNNLEFYIRQEKSNGYMYQLYRTLLNII